jgi:hypothetical protein
VSLVLWFPGSLSEGDIQMVSIVTVTSGKR